MPISKNLIYAIGIGLLDVVGKVMGRVLQVRVKLLAKDVLSDLQCSCQGMY